MKPGMLQAGGLALRGQDVHLDTAAAAGEFAQDRVPPAAGSSIACQHHFCDVV